MPSNGKNGSRMPVLSEDTLSSTDLVMMIAEGMSQVEIAHETGIAAETVYGQLAYLRDVYHARTLPALVAAFYHRGLLIPRVAYADNLV